MFDEEGVFGMNNFANFKDDGSVNSKQRLEFLKQMYTQSLYDYRSHLEDEHANEKNPDKREQLIQEELAAYQAALWQHFFPQISQLEKQIAQEERKSSLAAKKGKEPDKKDDKKDTNKKTDEKKDKKEQEKQPDKQEDKKTDTLNEDEKPKSKSQEIMEKFDTELKSNNINVTEIKEEFKDKNLNELDEAEQNRLSALVYKGLRFSIDKSESNDNPGWLLLYLKTIYPTLAQILPPPSLFNLSEMIMDGYLTKRHGLHYESIPPHYQDLKHHDKYKNKPIKEKMLLAEGIVAREMSFGHVSKQTSAPNTLTYLLDAVPFEDIEKTTEKKPDIYQEFNTAVNAPEITEPKKSKNSQIHYIHEEKPYIVPEEQLTDFGQFLLYTRKNKMVGIPAQEQIEKFEQDSPRKTSPLTSLKRAPIKNEDIISTTRAEV